MGAAFLRASLAGDGARAAALLGASLPDDWPMIEDVLRRRLVQLGEDPSREPWLTRAICSRTLGRLIGVTGFHGPPGGAWLRDFAPDGVEFGYTVLPAHRRQGIATEAGAALVTWAHQHHAVREFVLSMAPTNAASAGVARNLGFERVGSWEHQERGTEDVHRLRLGPGGLGS